MKYAIWMMVPVLALAACSDKPAGDSGGEVTEVTINAKDGEGGYVKIGADGKGSSISIDGDGVNINADLPGIDKIDIGGDFDIDGVKLYPGAKITSVNISADGNKPEGQQGVVDFGLTAPAAPAVVLGWYAEAFAAKGMTTTTTGRTLNGTTKDGDAFAIELMPDGAGSKGKVRISG